MKKVITLIMATAMVFSMSACGQNKEQATESISEQSAIVGEDPNTWGPDENVEIEEPEAEVALGGWNIVESPVITDDVKALFDKASENLVGASYTPVAYISSQVVAGTNHAILCKTATTSPGANETYAIVYLYENLEGNVEITDVLNSNVETNTSANAGGWNDVESPVVTDDVKAVFDKGIEGQTGVNYTPIAYISNQVVAGTNYCIFSEATQSVPDVEASYVFVFLYENLEGEVEVTDILDFDSKL